MDDMLPSSATFDRGHLAELMRRIASDGDRAAFGELFGLLAPRVKGYLMRIGADPGTADELAQDVMLTVWRRADRFDPAQAGVATWVFTIARNRRIDRLRRERRPEFNPSDPLLVPAPPESADAGIENEERQNRLRLAIGTLPKEQAELLYMAFYQDKAHGGIAAESNLPLGTVKSRLRLALARLRKALGEESGI